MRQRMGKKPDLEEIYKWREDDNFNKWSKYLLK